MRLEPEIAEMLRQVREESHIMRRGIEDALLRKLSESEWHLLHTTTTKLLEWVLS